MTGWFQGAPVTRLVLVGIGLVFLAELALGGSTNPATLVLLGANVPALVRAGEVWRLVASLFLHIGVVHLAVNGWALYQLGSLFENLMGSLRTALVFFASGIAGSLVSLVTAKDAEAISAGASGAIFGLLGALVAVLLRRRGQLRPAGRSLLMQLGGWAVFNVVLGFVLPGIDNGAHLGGCAAGLLLGWSLAPRWERPSSVDLQPGDPGSIDPRP
jgi:rhomboid protease GluP